MNVDRKRGGWTINCGEKERGEVAFAGLFSYMRGGIVRTRRKSADAEGAEWQTSASRTDKPHALSAAWWARSGGVQIPMLSIRSL